MVFRRVERDGNHEHVPERWSGIIGTGQSLSNGCQAPLPSFTPPVPNALKLSDSKNEFDCHQPGAHSLSVVPLTEPFRRMPNKDQYPTNILGQSPHSAMAAQTAWMTGKQGLPVFKTVHTCVGIGGAPMFDICKDGKKNSYEASIYEAKALTRIAKENSADLSYDCILMTHGEADALLGNREYGQSLMQLLDNYTKDLQKITHQKHNPVMVLSQQNTCPMDRIYPSPVINQQWKIQLWSDNAIICSGPKYQFKYPDGLHLTQQGYNRLGEKYGQVYHQHIIENRPWVPLSPKKVTLIDNKTIRVDFNVPCPPLRWDDHLPKPHSEGDNALKCWAKGRGFEIRGVRAKPLNISNVFIDASGTSVTITLAEATKPHQHPLAVGYAMTQSGNGFLGGRPNGRIGHLRDSDSTVPCNTETLRCKVTPGSEEILCPDKGFMKRAVYDNVEANGEHYTIMAIPPARTRATLSRPWKGKAGWCDVQFGTQMANYCVSFAENTGWNEEQEKERGRRMREGDWMDELKK